MTIAAREHEQGDGDTEQLAVALRFVAASDRAQQHQAERSNEQDADREGPPRQLERAVGAGHERQRQGEDGGDGGDPQREPRPVGAHDDRCSSRCGLSGLVHTAATPAATPIVTRNATFRLISGRMNSTHQNTR